MYAALLASSSREHSGPPLARVISHVPATGPGSIPLSEDFIVAVNGTTVPCYLFKIPIRHQWISGDPPSGAELVDGGFAHFDMEDGIANCTISIANRGPITSAKILPSRLGIVPAITSENTVSFTMPKTGAYCLQVNGDKDKRLHLFARPPITSAPARSGDPNVRYYAPGNVTRDNSKFIHYFRGPGVYSLKTGSGDRWQLRSNDYVFVEAGAVLLGRFAGENANTVPLSNIRIDGRGILEGGIIPDQAGSPVYFHDINGLSIGGITIRDSAGWTTKLFHCKNITIDGYTALNWRQTTDGLDLLNCQDATVRNLLLVNFDDGVCVKGVGDGNDVNDVMYPNPRVYADDQNICRGITVEDCQIWSAVGLGGIEFGYKCGAPEMYDIHWRNIDICESYQRTAIGIHIEDQPGDEANVHHVTYDNIWIENHQGNPFNGRNIIHFEVKGASDASIYDIDLQNIFVSGTLHPSLLIGRAAPYDVHDIRLKNFRHNGALLLSAAAANMRLTNATNVSFAP